MPTVSAAAIALNDLIPSARNIRSRLGDLSGMAQSMREVGVLQPLLVHPHPTRAGKYVIVGGHRRHAAAQIAGLKTVPCLIRAGDKADQTGLMLVENAQRQALDPIDMARAFEALAKKHPLSQVARMTGFSPATVRARMGLLTLPTQAQDMISDGKITLADAQVLVSQVADQRTPGASRSTPRAVSVGRKRAVPHFDKSHPLAAHVQERCTHTTTNRRTYGHGCGPCWEATIREDALGTLPASPTRSVERGAATVTTLRTSTAADPNADADAIRSPTREYDQAAVERIVTGGFNAHTGQLSVGDREEIVRRLHTRGYSDRRIAAQAGFSDRTVLRIRTRLALPAVPTDDMVTMTAPAQ